MKCMEILQMGLVVMVHSRPVRVQVIDFSPTDHGADTGERHSAPSATIVFGQPIDNRAEKWSSWEVNISPSDIWVRNLLLEQARADYGPSQPDPFEEFL